MTSIVVGIIIAAALPLFIGAVFLLNSLLNEIWQDEAAKDPEDRK